jgi:hypothetical protein
MNVTDGAASEGGNRRVELGRKAGTGLVNFGAAHGEANAWRRLFLALSCLCFYYIAFFHCFFSYFLLYFICWPSIVSCSMLSSMLHRSSQCPRWSNKPASSGPAHLAENLFLASPSTCMNQSTGTP